MRGRNTTVFIRIFLEDIQELVSLNLLQRFIDKFDLVGSGCWIWNTRLQKGGYGQFKYQGKTLLAHRYSYSAFKGRIPDGLTIDHLCRNRACVNPSHLEAVTLHENLLRGVGFVAINAKKTHCKNGHAFDKENTKIRVDGTGRACIACKRAAKKRYNLRLKEERKKIKETALSINMSTR